MTAQVVDSFPLVASTPKLLRLPLKRVEQVHDEHGQIYLQLHINRSIRRLARMTGRQEPTDEELLSRLEKHVLSIKNLGGSERRALEKRYSRPNVSKNGGFNSGSKDVGPQNNRKKNPDNLNDGEITFGGLDTTKFDAETLVTLPNVNKGGLWEADLAAVTVNGDDVGLTGRIAILDTGTTLLVVPLEDATSIHALINGSRTDGQGGFSVPCTLTDKVALQFGNHSFEIDPRDMAFAPLDPADPEGDCASGIIATSIDGIGRHSGLSETFSLKTPISPQMSQRTR